jgi:hypothetical protein
LPMPRLGVAARISVRVGVGGLDMVGVLAVGGSIRGGCIIVSGCSGGVVVTTGLCRGHAWRG